MTGPEPADETNYQKSKLGRYSMMNHEMTGSKSGDQMYSIGALDTPPPTVLPLKIRGSCASPAVYHRFARYGMGIRIGGKINLVF